MGYFKRLDIEIHDFIKCVVACIAIISSVGVFMLGFENAKIRERYELIKHENTELMKENTEVFKENELLKNIINSYDKSNLK